MTQPPQLISQEQFTNALVEGISIPANRDLELFEFGTRLVEWINDTDNEYWACWNPELKNNIIIDMKNINIINLRLESGRIIFHKPDNGAAEDLPKEFGNGAIGIILFCMMENEELEEIALDKIHKKDISASAPETEKKEPPDFEWI
ncbi:MAG TPA: hypothetical protein EYQ00_10905 [Dehalococcoidia bacterium]|jgi:hypothetical protein|nr:hypothetical protein [Dehalococcoidia bacterium]